MIHIKAGNIFFNKKNNGESIYDLFAAQQDYSKRLLKMRLTFLADHDAYVSKIKSTNNNKYDMVTNNNLKFLVYHLNDYLDRQLRLVERIRHTIIFEDEHDLFELQCEDWPYFIEKRFDNVRKEQYPHTQIAWFWGGGVPVRQHGLHRI